MGGVPLLKMEDTDGDFKFAKRKNEGTWINTGLHGQAWKAIKAAGEYESADWVVKVDCDAVFVPSRLASWLQGQAVPKNGMYLENCRYVKYGWFGSLEIFSREAFETHTDGMCESDRPEDEKKNKKWKPTCTEVNTAGYHPLKTPEDWWACREATTKAFGY